MRKLITVLVVVLVVPLGGCDLLDRLLPEPEPECPYPSWVCGLLDELPIDEIGERVECVRGCLSLEDEE